MCLQASDATAGEEEHEEREGRGPLGPRTEVRVARGWTLQTHDFQLAHCAALLPPVAGFAPVRLRCDCCLRRTCFFCPGTCVHFLFYTFAHSLTAVVTSFHTPYRPNQIHNSLVICFLRYGLLISTKLTTSDQFFEAGTILRTSRPPISPFMK